MDFRAGCSLEAMMTSTVLDRCVRLLPAAIMCWLAWCGAAVAAQQPKAADNTPPGASAGSAGPRTEAVDLAVYAAIRYVRSGRTAFRGANGDQPAGNLAQVMSGIGDAGPMRRYAILVAAGTYPIKDLSLKPYVDLYGGYPPESWTSRDVARYHTVLHAQGRGRVLVGADHAVVDGFTLRSGRVNGHGGAVLCDRTSPTLSNNTFQENSTSEPPGYLRGVFHQVGAEGGAIACLRYASPRIEHNLFVGNWTDIGGGGAIAMRSDSVRPPEERAAPTVRGNVFIGNRTGTGDTDTDLKKRYRSSNGGAISLSNYNADILDNVFVGNYAGGNGDGGGIYCEYEASPRIAHNHFVGNRAEDDGAAIYSMKLSEPVIERNVFSGNTGGGTIRVSKQGRAVLTGNLVFANPTGGIFAGDSWSVLQDNVIMDNIGIGLGLRIQTAAYIRPSVVRRNVLRGNTAAQILLEDTEALVQGNNVQGGFAGEGNRDADPRLDTARRPFSVQRVTYDPVAGSSVVSVISTPSGSEVAGRVARIGERWGVVKRIDRNIEVWGDVRGTGAGELFGSYAPLPPAR